MLSSSGFHRTSQSDPPLQISAMLHYSNWFAELGHELIEVNASSGNCFFDDFFGVFESQTKMPTHHKIIFK